MVCNVSQRRPIAVVAPPAPSTSYMVPTTSTWPLAGFSVEEIQYSLRDVLNVDMLADAYVDGRLALSSHRLLPGDRSSSWGGGAERVPEMSARIGRRRMATFSYIVAIVGSFCRIWVTLGIR